MPFEKFCLCSRNVLFLAAPTQVPQKFEKCSESRTLFWGDRPRFPRSLSWKRSRAFRRVWHKPERILEAIAFFAFPETKESKTTGRLCSSLTCHISMVDVFNSMRMQLLWTSEYPPCIWWYVWGENRRTSVSGKWYETQGKYTGLPLMSVNLWRVVPIPTTVLTLVTFLTGIWHLT
jgi:hypothetical protein